MATTVLTLPSTTVVPPRQAVIEYPESDGEPLGETGIHVLATLGLFGALKHFFSTHPDVYVAADMFLYYKEGNPRARTAPDVMVIKGVPNVERRIFKLWEEPAAPCTVFEVISRSTWREDAIAKTALYARLGVREYFLFDPDADMLPEQLIGYRLEEGMYVPIAPEADGTLASVELGLRFRVEGYMLRVIDPATGEPIPTLQEALRRAEAEAARAEQEATRAEAEAARAAAAEAEVARLRALLGQS
ncbi:MAG: Uma2 family endonuclease [Caldilineales bacterium]|nr:Uma2 family endonuclease [Caldilineales bacterium]